MYYVIVSNIGLALMTVIIYLRYSRFRFSSLQEVSELRKSLNRSLDDRQNMEDRLLSETKVDSDKIEKLLREIDELRKEKEGEIKLRFELEKQLEVSVQKALELQKRIDDRQAIQEEMNKNSKETIIKIGNDLYKKLSDSYKVEVETNKNLIGRVSENIAKFFEKNMAVKTSAVKQENLVKKVAAAIPPAKPMVHQHIIVADPAKKLVPDLVETMNAGGQLVNKDYFLAANFPEQKAKLLLCDIAFIKQKKLHILDFKACHYLAEYEQLKAQNKHAAEENLKHHFEKYFAYLANEKYRDSILKALSATAEQFERIIIAMIVSDKSGLQVIKEIHYDDKATKAQLEILDFDGAINLVL